ncbi:SDR family NAD(P)-dependent oxidoreductase, partial [Bacillus sp. WP8]|uniref:SDR family NAD(P)-dependent oxidoreductase n=1 Tax=Bacillus sp. WP8 TaxID=756828 RepID=UPI0021B2595E
MDNWKKVMCRNLRGMFVGWGDGVKYMRDDGIEGWMINMWCVDEEIGWVDFVDYGGSKGGGKVLRERLGVEYGGKKMGVKSIGGGGIDRG